MKQFQSPNDFALKGAPPAFDEPLHVGRPNIGSREAFLEYANDIFDRRWLSNNGPFGAAIRATGGRLSRRQTLCRHV